MKTPPPATSLAVGETRLEAAPAALATLGARACFVLVLHDPKTRVGAMTHLQASNGGMLGHYLKLTIQRLLAEMHGAGCARNRVQAHVIADEATPAHTLRTISGTLRSQGIERISLNTSGGAGRSIRFDLGTGQVSVQEAARPEGIKDIKELAVLLGSQLLDLHAFQKEQPAAQPGLPLARLLQQIADTAASALGGASCLVALSASDPAEPGLQAASRSWALSASGADGALRQRLAAWAARRRAPTLVKNSQRDPELAALSPRPLALLSVPLGEGEPPLGVICASYPLAGAFSDENLQMLQFFAHQTAIAIGNARTVQRLEARAREMEAIMQGIADGIVVVDPELRLVMVNPVAKEYLDIGANCAPGEGFPARSPLARLLLQALERGTCVGEAQVETRGHGHIICQAMVSRVTGADGRPAGLVAVLRDITEQRRMEQIKSNLLSIVSHELRTPLHSISGFVDIILMGKTGELTELQRDFLTTVKRQSAQLQNIINDLLEFTRLEYGHIKLTTEPVRLREIADHVLHKLAVLADEHRIQLGNDVPEELVVEGDSVRLEQVLTNLVDNAFKFTPAEGRVTVGAADLGAEAELWVTDTGIGIAPEDQDKIFEMFYQVTEGSNGARRGAGLGLAICKHIVECHQGQIWVESEQGRGSTFRIVLPKRLNRGEELALDFAHLERTAPAVMARPAASARREAPVPEDVLETEEALA